MTQVSITACLVFLLLFRKGMFGLKLKKKKKNKGEKGLVLANKGAQGEARGAVLTWGWGLTEGTLLG